MDRRLFELRSKLLALVTSQDDGFQPAVAISATTFMSLLPLYSGIYCSYTYFQPQSLKSTVTIEKFSRKNFQTWLSKLHLLLMKGVWNIVCGK